jgi:pyruvate/2-oxoglutarate dehydrogenase complex dihydrolipoamide dehydrogenase (E3) component
MGGDCLNVGCVPSKALIAAARVAAAVGNAGEYGVEVPAGTRVDFAAVMERMRRLRALLSPTDSAARFRSLGVDVFLGAGQFTAPDTVEVAGKTLRFRRAVIATGARASTLPIPGLADAGYLTNESVFSLTELPRRLAVIGAGPIGCELAQAFARFGSEVTVLEMMPQILPMEDRDAAGLVEQSLIRDGVRFVVECKIHGVQNQDGERVLQVESRGSKSELHADAILVGGGRTPNVEGLNLEAAGVTYDAKQGVHVNDRLQTRNPKIYAAGDICSRYKFTHLSDAHARIVIQNALFFGRAKASALILPWCTYTDPEIAHVGLYEHEAQKQGIAIDTIRQDLAHVDRAVLDGETAGFVKVHLAKGKDKILGATIVAAHAGDLISEITLAKTIHPYPTQAEAIKKVGDAYNRTRLTPFVKGLFQKWLAWMR